MKVQLSENFRKNVRSILREREISDLQFVSSNGIGSRTYFSNVMNGKSVPGLDYCEQIAKCLKVPVVELLEKPKKLAKSA